MSITRTLAATSAVALLTLAGATAASADEYGEPPANPPAGPSSVEPGAPFTVTFNSAPTVCDWTLTPFEGQTAAPGGPSTSYSVTLNAPVEPGNYTVSATCTYGVDPDAPQAASAGVAQATQASFVPAGLAAARPTKAFSFSFTSGDPAAAGGGSGSAAGNGSDGGGLLPDTGGARTELLLVGAGLVAAGAGVTVAARRRHNAA